MELTELRPHLDKQVYDKYYQDIVCIGFKGYSESYKTWASIKDEINWKGKKVADFGCFHGYFSFQIAKLKADVVGFEKSSSVLKTTDIINDLEGSIISTQVWKDTDPVHEKFDVALFLNVIHHFEKPDLVLRNIKCDTAIFEINTNQEALVAGYFEIIKRIPSHRENRIILIGKKIFSLYNTPVFPESKIFVTGIYGSGKTTFAKAYAKHAKLKYIDFDMYFTYSKINPNLSASAEENIFNILSDRFVIDAIPFSIEGGKTKNFIKYARENTIRIVCCVCTDKAEWIERVEKTKQVKVDLSRYSHYATFYYKTILMYSEFDVQFYDTCLNEYITKEQLYSRINWFKPILEFL